MGKLFLCFPILKKYIENVNLDRGLSRADKKNLNIGYDMKAELKWRCLKIRQKARHVWKGLKIGIQKSSISRSFSDVKLSRYTIFIGFQYMWCITFTFEKNHYHYL